MTRGEVTVIGGRPGHGKTKMIINIVKRLLEQGKRVMLFNREMTNVEMMKKILVKVRAQNLFTNYLKLAKSLTKINFLQL